MARVPGRRDWVRHRIDTEEDLREVRLRAGDIGGTPFLNDDGFVYTEPDAAGFSGDFEGGHDVTTNGNGWTVDTEGGVIFLDTAAGSFRLAADGSAVLDDADLSIGQNLSLAYEAINDAVGSGATTLAVTFAGSLPNQADSSYGVLVTPHWNTTVWVTSKATTGFTINFGTAPVPGNSVDWILVR